MGSLAGFAFPILIIGAIIFFALYGERKRREAFGRVAADLNLQFDPTGNALSLGEVGSFQLTSQGQSRKLRNLLTGEWQGLPVAIFDYSYSTGHGKNRTTISSNVIYFRAPALRLPGFELRPENFFHKIGAVFGYQDINFPEHPNFSKKYLLRGPDEAAVRQLFQPAIIETIERLAGLCAEGTGDRLIIYRTTKTASPEDLPRRLEEAHGLYQLFAGG